MLITCHACVKLGRIALATAARAWIEPTAAAVIPALAIRGVKEVLIGSKLRRLEAWYRFCRGTGAENNELKQLSLATGCQHPVDRW
jgi:hypothetical protein